MFDLLWKYYEKTRNYAAAAKILAKLADRHSTEINLQQRIEYLSRAIICVKSGEICMESHRGGTGQLLHDLEEKMEVARVQLQVLENINGLRGQVPEAETAISQLNSDLIDLTQLYSDFAEPFGLNECILAILHCAGHLDTMLIENIWNKVLDAEIERSQNSASTQSKINILSNKLKSLGKMYASSQKYFPMGMNFRYVSTHSCRDNPSVGFIVIDFHFLFPEFIVKKLELYSVQIHGDYEWVFKTLLSVGISLPKVFEVYNR